MGIRFLSEHDLEFKRHIRGKLPELEAQPRSPAAIVPEPDLAAWGKRQIEPSAAERGIGYPDSRRGLEIDSFLVLEEGDILACGHDRRAVNNVSRDDHPSFEHALPSEIVVLCYRMVGGGTADDEGDQAEGNRFGFHGGGFLSGGSGS